MSLTPEAQQPSSPARPNPAAQMAIGWEVVDPEGNVVQSGPVTYVDVSGLVGAGQDDSPATDQSEETPK